MLPSGQVFLTTAPLGRRVELGRCAWASKGWDSTYKQTTERDCATMVTTTPVGLTTTNIAILSLNSSLWQPRAKIRGKTGFYATAFTQSVSS